MKIERRVVYALVAAVLLALVVYIFRTRIHFDWTTFWSQLRHADPKRLLIATLLIYSTYILRSIRWAVFVAPVKRIPPFTLVGTQFVGFSAVAVFGRLADLARPYLVARRIDLSLSSQMAVYTVERMFDLGAAALIFSSALLFAPKNMPHHEVFLKAGPVSLGITAAAALIAILIRVAGPSVAAFIRKASAGLAPELGESVATKVLEFRDGLNAVGSARGLLLSLVISLTMWGLIGLAYLETTHAFPQTPELAATTYSSVMLLMAASIGGSLLQLPVLGWFTQIAVTATAMHSFYGAPIEAATACGGALLFVTFLSIIPMGLIFAKLEGTSLKAAAKSSKADQVAIKTHTDARTAISGGNS